MGAEGENTYSYSAECVRPVVNQCDHCGRDIKRDSHMLESFSIHTGKYSIHYLCSECWKTPEKNSNATLVA